jgi:hypothetical protein
MTEEQEQQLRAILDIEGFATKEIEQLTTDFKRKPDVAQKVLREWKLVTEQKQ